MTELGIIAQAFEFAKINQVKGDYFEFGIWRGKTFSYAHKMRRRYGLPGVMLRGFDSFEGLPAHEDTTDNIWHKGQFAATEAEVRRLLRKNGIGEREYTLVPGFYSESLNEALDAQPMGVSAAIVYIDCDLYESTARVLAFIKKYLVNGSVVCFDDYYNNRGAPDQGEQRGLQENSLPLTETYGSFRILTIARSGNHSLCGWTEAFLAPPGASQRSGMV